MPRPSPRTILEKVDLHLSKAQQELSNLITAETRETSPQAHRLGDSLWERLERIRWDMRKFRP